jgi:hypothetical protein
MSDVFKGNFKCWDDVVNRFSDRDVYAKADKNSGKLKHLYNQPEVILYAEYNTDEPYEGYAIVSYYDEGKFYLVIGQHCSCFELEGQWDPEEYDLDTFVGMIDRRIEAIKNAGHDQNIDYGDNPLETVEIWNGIKESARDVIMFKDSDFYTDYKKGENNILGLCSYALGLAITNTEIAYQKEPREIIKKEYLDDLRYFSELKSTIEMRIDNFKAVKRGIKK